MRDQKLLSPTPPPSKPAPKARSPAPTRPSSCTCTARTAPSNSGRSTSPCLPGLLGKLAGVAECPQSRDRRLTPNEDRRRRAGHRLLPGGLRSRHGQRRRRRRPDALLGHRPRLPRRSRSSLQGRPAQPRNRHPGTRRPLRPRRRRRPLRPLRQPPDRPDHGQIRPDPHRAQGHPARSAHDRRQDGPAEFHPQPDLLRTDVGGGRCVLDARPGRRTRRPLPGRRLRGLAFIPSSLSVSLAPPSAPVRRHSRRC